VWDFSRMVVDGYDNNKRRKLQTPLGDVAVHLRGGTIVAMQEPALVTRDVRLAPITLVIALPSQPCTGSLGFTGPIPPYVHEESCATVYSRNLGQHVACGYIFMDNGEEVSISTENSVQVRLMVKCMTRKAAAAAPQVGLRSRHVRCGTG